VCDGLPRRPARLRPNGPHRRRGHLAVQDPVVDDPAQRGGQGARGRRATAAWRSAGAPSGCQGSSLSALSRRSTSPTPCTWSRGSRGSSAMRRRRAPRAAAARVSASTMGDEQSASFTFTSQRKSTGWASSVRVGASAPRPSRWGGPRQRSSMGDER
jgi:hypothetical protein